MKNVIMLGLVTTMLVACGKKEEVAAPVAPAVVEAPAPAAEVAPAASAPAVAEKAEKAPVK